MTSQPVEQRVAEIEALILSDGYDLQARQMMRWLVDQLRTALTEVRRLGEYAMGKATIATAAETRRAETALANAALAEEK